MLNIGDLNVTTPNTSLARIDSKVEQSFNTNLTTVCAPYTTEDLAYPAKASSIAYLNMAYGMNLTTSMHAGIPIPCGIFANLFDNHEK